jgi:hypothetical protein
MYGPTPYGKQINYKDIKKIQYQKPNVIWLMLDGFFESDEFNWYQEPRVKACIEFEKICCAHPQKHFFLMTEMRGLGSLINANNLTIIELPHITWIAGSGDRGHGYLTKADVQFHWLSFINSPRWHRVCLLSYLLCQNLDANGAFTISKSFFERCKEFEHIYNFLTYEFSWPMYQQLDMGYQRIINHNIQPLSLPPYSDYHNQNTSNYNQVLLPIYNHTRLEIVCNTLFSEPYLLMSEKEIQGIYACNFVIFISTVGTVDYLRNLGFDMFDDVINHDYDFVVEPHLRVIKAIDDNLHLLNGSMNLDKMWQDRQERFMHNCFLADKIIKLAKTQSTVDDIIDRIQCPK